MALTKESIIDSVFETADLPKKESRNAVEATLEIMKETLGVGEDILVSGFGKFMVKEKMPRRGRNPQTNEDIQLPGRKVVVFKTSGVLRTNINNGHVAG